RSPPLAPARGCYRACEQHDRLVAASESLIFRYAEEMRTISATDASRRFSDLLDAIEAGESVVVTRGNRPIAEVRPAIRRTGRDLRAALAEMEPPDERFAADVEGAVAGLIQEGDDPWAAD
ncbi:MAG TPA: type II toxin-antitoxin system prevent-host-death family antitoxin, partial [Ilumatobacteraceae bacterium]|nr:type II toxin-antitoxin system prevent-host-death family antitoxin [Ilumatobacteraceae bacterium]